VSNFVLFVIALFVIAALLRIDFFFSILYLFIGVYVATRFWTRRMLAKLTIERSLPTHAFLGETVPVKLTVQNQSNLPVPWLMLNETFSNVLSTPPFFRQVITLRGKASHAVTYELSARRRGYYAVGPLRLEAGDLLGLSRRLSGQFAAHALIVYPKILPIANLKLPTFSPQVILPASTPLFHDSTRLTGVRDYVPGDNPRHIHWPATAATNRLLVKQFQTAIARETVIYLNMNLSEYGRSGQAEIALELAIITAASLANHMIAREALPVGLVTTAFDPVTATPREFRVPPGKGQGHLMQVLEVLARIEGVADPDFLRRLQQEVVRLAWGTTITLITCQETDPLLQSVLLLKRSGFHVAVIFVQPAAYPYPRPQRVRILSIPAVHVTREKDVEVWPLLA
jgi:uncharacterized protein (DUF58 family)